VLELCAVFHNDLCNRIREILSAVARHETLDQRRRAVFFGNNQQSRKIRTVVCISSERDLQRPFEFYILRNPQKDTGLQESRVQRGQPVVVITGVPRQVFANDLVVARVFNRAEEIDRDHVAETSLRRQVFAQKTIYNDEMSLSSLGIAFDFTRFSRTTRDRHKLFFRERREICVFPVFFFYRRETELLETIHRAVAYELAPDLEQTIAVERFSGVESESAQDLDVVLVTGRAGRDLMRPQRLRPRLLQLAHRTSSWLSRKCDR